MPSLYPEWRLFYFCPFIVMSLYRVDLLKSLIMAFAIGIFLSFFSLDSRFGVIGSILVLTSVLVNPLKQYLFADRFYTLPLMTYVYAVVFTILQGFIFSTFSSSDFPVRAFFTEGLIMPLGDALFAFGVFVLPSMIFKSMRIFRLKPAYND